MSSPREKLPLNSPLMNRTPRAERAFDSWGEASFRRTTVFADAIPRYSAVTSRENLPAVVETSALFFWSWPPTHAGRRAARIANRRALPRRFILPNRTENGRFRIPVTDGDRLGDC